MPKAKTTPEKEPKEAAPSEKEQPGSPLKTEDLEIGPIEREAPKVAAGEERTSTQAKKVS